MNPRDFILSRSGRARRTREGYWSYHPDPLPPPLEWSPAMLAALSDAERSLGQLAATTRLLSEHDTFATLLDAQEAVCSCRIDGFAVPLSDLLQSIHSLASTQPDLSEIACARNCYQALSRLRRAPANYSVSLLLSLHALVFPHDSEAGAFRTEQNWIGPPGSTLEAAAFVPPPPERLERGLDQLASFITSETRLPGIIRLALAHYQFEALHPFPKGNGRLGRLLAAALPIYFPDGQLPLLYLSDQLLARRQDYFDLLLAVSQRSAWEEWLVFFLEAAAASAQVTMQRLNALQELKQEYQQMVSSARNAPRLGRLLDFAFSQPVFTVRGAEAALGVNFAVAQRYANQLEAYGVIEETTGQARNRIYRLAGILDILI
ncbi:MAG: Fic family protein [Anaerolineales bacterium]|nr:Fic family protein [Anaerolineales bacterium]